MRAPLSTSAWRMVVIATALLACLWAFDAFVLRTTLLASFQGQSPLTPLYSFWRPRLSPRTWAFALAAVLFVAAAPCACDPQRLSRRWFLVALAASAMLLAWALFLVREKAGSLGAQFLIYPKDEFLSDAQRITDPFEFLARYVEHMPALSTHGRHFPPGHALTLYTVARLFGPGTFPAGLFVLVCASGGSLFAFLGLREIASERAARAAALLCIATPSFLDFACTSMDAVYFALAAGAWCLGVRALSPRGNRMQALALGAVLALACCFSFSTLPLGFLLGLFACFGLERRVALERLLFAGAGCAIFVLALRVLTGFSLVACLRVALTQAHELLRGSIDHTPRADWLHTSYGNLVALALGAGVGLVALVLTRREMLGALGLASVTTLFVMSFGGVYHMETERIWLFTLPWLAAIALPALELWPSALRVFLGAGLVHALLAEICLFTLW